MSDSKNMSVHTRRIFFHGGKKVCAQNAMMLVVDLHADFHSVTQVIWAPLRSVFGPHVPPKKCRAELSQI